MWGSRERGSTEPFPCRKVLRDGRLKESSAGVPFTAEEARTWEVGIADYFNQVSSEPPTKKCRRAAPRFCPPRLATLGWLRAVENSLRVMCHMDLSCFLYEGAIASARIEQKKVVFSADVPLDSDGVPAVLTLTTDQHSVQTCGVSFMKYCLRAAVEHIADPFHASWNATLEGASRSGCTGVLRCGVTIANLAYGPFQRSVFFRDMNSSALEMSSSLIVDDLLLNYLWPRIAKDRGLSQVSSMGAESRQAFLDELPRTKAASLKGPKAATSRWYPVLKALQWWSSDWNVKLLILMFVAIRKGFSTSLEDILKPSREHIKECLAEVSGAVEMPALENGSAAAALADGHGASDAAPSVAFERNPPLPAAAPRMQRRRASASPPQQRPGLRRQASPKARRGWRPSAAGAQTHYMRCVG